ncbi:MAG: 50S ribosomal protein L4 [Candidatus Bathyarchaeia archaeon]
MKAVVIDLEGKPIRELELPRIFQTKYRPDLIRRAVVALQTHRLQPQGRDPMAGKRTSAESYGVGHGLSRVPRVKGERHPRAGAAAFSPGTVKGRLAHPPRAEKAIWKKINRKERGLALASAIAATGNKELVQRRGHVTNGISNFPIIVSDEIQKLDRTSKVIQALKGIGIWKDVERVISRQKILPRGSRSRGRAKRIPKGPLIVVGSDEGIVRGAKNIPGVDVMTINKLNVEALAPGTHAGRLTLWSESAISGLGALFGSVVSH